MSKVIAQKIVERLAANDIRSILQCFHFGVERVDAAMGEGLARGSVHEIFLAHPKDVTSAFGFTLALALRAAATKSILICQQDFLDTEAGDINAAGLNEMGVDPLRVILVRARDAEGILRAGEQAARCAALGAVVIVPWGEAKILNFTASRRLSLAAAKSSVPIFMLRAGAKPSQSAASTRWSIRSAPSRALEANAPGFPAFDLTLLRHRGGVAGHVWRVEWDRERQSFQDCQLNDDAQVSGPMVSVSQHGQAASAADQIAWRAAG